MTETALAQDARAVILAASKIEGEDPDAVMAGRTRSRARVYAFVALAHRYPKIKHDDVMIACGVPADRAEDKTRIVVATLRGKGGKWFCLERLNAILAVVGWEPMTREDASVRRRTPEPRRSPESCAVESAALAVWIADLMGQNEAMRTALAERAGAE